MKQILAILVLLGSMSLMACAQGSKKQTMKTASETHVLVAYFSATGTTAAVAEKLAQATGGKLWFRGIPLPTLTGTTRSRAVRRKWTIPRFVRQ